MAFNKVDPREGSRKDKIEDRKSGPEGSKKDERQDKKMGMREESITKTVKYPWRD